MKNILLAPFVLLFAMSAQAQQKLVPADAGSKVHFVIRNFGINTNGEISGLKGQIIFDKNKLAKSSFDITAEVSSINTDNKKRDHHLRAADYFDVAKFPLMRITGKPLLVKGNTYILKGNLTIKDVTRAIEIPFTATPQQNKILFTGDFKINRVEFHIGENSAILSDEVKITFQVLAQ